MPASSRCVLLVTLTSVLCVACAETSTPAPIPEQLRAGTWGGAEAGVLVSDTVAHVHVGCTNGNFPSPIHLDAQGRFDVTGSYQPRAFPIPFGPEVPARMTGQLHGNSVTFVVVVDDTVAHQTLTLGPKQVRYGAEPGMTICPICRDPGMPRRDGVRIFAAADATRRKGH